MIKNTASQKWIVFAFDVTTNLPVTGDADQITANLRLDGGIANAVDDDNPTELENGYYIFDITQAESNGNLIVICPESSTDDVVVIGVPGAVWTEPEGRKYAATLASTDVTGNINVKIAATDDIAFSPTQIASLATSVWDSLHADHIGAGSFGLYLDQKVSEVTATLASGDVRDAIGLASANLDTQLAALPTAVENRQEMDSNSTQLTAIVADTNELELDWKNGGRLDTIIDSILADTNELELDWKNGGRLDLILDAIKATTDTLGTGSGAITFVYTLTDDSTGLPIENADVWATTDEAGTNVVAVSITNASGEVTFYLDADTYYIWRSCSGYTFTNPDTEVVA